MTIFEGVIIVGLIIYFVTSILVGLRDYKEWRDREDYILNVLQFSSGAYPRYTKGVFGTHNLLMAPSLLVILIGMVIYKTIKEDW